MRRLNVKLLLYLTGGTFALAGVLFAVHRLQASSIGTGLLWQADQADKEGTPTQAARYLRRYLEFAPNDLDTRARLGRTLADPRVAVSPRTRDRARYCLEEVLSKDGERHDIRRCLVRLALDVRAFDLADEHLKILKQKCPNDGEVSGLVGRYQELKGEEKGALGTLRDSVRQAPGVAENYVRLIQLLRRQDAGRRGNDFKEAEELLATALSKAPDDAGVLVAAGELAQDKGDLKQARERLKRAVKLHPKDAKAHAALARLDLRENNRTAAVNALRRGLHAVHKEDKYELNWALANLLIDGNELDEARKIAQQIQEENGSSGAPDYLQARALMQKARWFEAVRILERVRPTFKSAPALTVQVDLLMAACYENLDEPAQQLAACIRVVDVDRASVLARQGIASAHWALGNHDAAIEVYRHIVQINDALSQRPSGRSELARLLVQRTMQREPRDWKDALAAVNEAEKEQPGSVDVAMMRAEIYAAKKEYDNAQAILLSVIKDNSKAVPAWTALATLTERRGEPKKALDLLDAAEKDNPGQPELWLARARYWGGRPKDEAGPPLRKLEENIPEAKRAAVLNALAEAHLRTGNAAEAARVWNVLAKQPSHATDLRLRMLLFDLALQERDDGAADKVLSDIRALEGSESALWYFGQASRKLMQARQGNRPALQEAKVLLEKAAAMRPAWPAVLLARAELEELQGNADLAIAGYRRAVEAGVRSPRVVRQLVQLLMTRFRNEEAKQLLQHLAQTGGLSDELRHLGISLDARGAEPRRVEEILRNAGTDASKEYRDHLWAGHLRSQNSRKSPEAEKSFRKAVELADTKPETWVALVQYLANTGQQAEAKAELEKARAKLSGPDAPLALAQCCETVGDLAQAREQYKAALAARPQEIAVRRLAVGFSLRTGDPAGAAAILRDIVSKKVAATEAEVAWAKRALALTLASTPGANRAAEALALAGFSIDARGALTEAPAPAGGYTVEEQVVRARVLATQSNKPMRDRAIAILDELSKRQALPPDEQLLLAQLYQRNGDGPSWAKARDLMSGLVSSQPRNAMYLTLFATSLLENNDVHTAETHIRKLEELEKGRPASAASVAVELKARALEARGKGAEALALLKAYAEGEGAGPERMLLCAGLHGRLGQVKEALDVVERVRAKCPPEAVGGASVAVLRAAKSAAKVNEAAWSAQAARAEGWLKEMSAKDADNLALRLQSADLFDLLGREADVEQAYRQVLQRDPRNHMALNNLAWMLAQRPGRAADGLKLIVEAVAAHGPRAELLDTRAVIYLTLNQPEKAVADLERAVADGPTPTKFWHMAQAYQRAKNTPAAQRALARATGAGLTEQRLHPSEREAFRRLRAELKQ